MASQNLRAQTTTRARSPVSSDTVTPNFTDPSFDPVDFLNDTLPPLTLASPSQPPASRSVSAASVPIGELSAQLQSLLSQISSLNVRHANNLNGFTDDILRSGGRLAYEVEVLRGEAIGLSDSLADVLHDNIVKFVPEGFEEEKQEEEEGEEEGAKNCAEEQKVHNKTTGQLGNHCTADESTTTTDPEYITKLRTLTQVRARLEDVIRIFGEAMDWPLAPSESSLTSASFISVSAPETSLDSQIQEKKGQEAAKKIRDSVVELLNSEEKEEGGVEAASRRVESLRVLSAVWRRTAEERPRTKFVDSLARIVEDRRRALESRQAKSASTANQDGHSSTGEQNRENEAGGGGGATGGGGGGFLWNLQRLREEIYLE